MGLAVAIAAATVAFQQERQRDPHVAYSRFQLPGFDAYVYVAMAERPSIFTVAPWGHRILVPALVHALGFRNAVRGFRLVSFAGVAASGGLLFLFLRPRFLLAVLSTTLRLLVLRSTVSSSVAL